MENLTTNYNESNHLDLYFYISQDYIDKINILNIKTLNKVYKI